MSCSPERISSYRRHFHGSTSSLVKVRVSSPSPVRVSTRSASYSTAAKAASAGRMSRTASSSRRLPIVAVNSGGMFGGGFGRGPPMVDLDAAAAENQEFLSTRSGERQEMIVLNDRLAAYIEKVHSLETQNALLESEIEALQNRFVKPTGMRRLYEDQLKELLRIANQARVQRDLAVAAKEAMAGQLEEIKRRYEEAMEQRKQAEMDLVALRPDVDRATSTRIAMEKQLEQLEAEIEFLKRIQKEEIEELMQQIYSAVATAQSSFALPDLSSALKQIQTQYEAIAAKNLQEMDSWYGSKFEDMGNKSSRHIDKLRSAREEMNNMKKDIQNKEQDLEDLGSKNDALEAQLRETQERHKAELENLKARIEALQAELKTTKQKTAKLLHEYQELLNIKMALEVEIITYRKLIEGEDSRLTVMQLSLGSSGSLGASRVGTSTVTVGGSVPAPSGEGSVTGKDREGSVTGKDREGSVPGNGREGSVTGKDREGSVTGKDREGSVPGNGREGSVTGKDREGSVKAKNGVPGTGSALSGSDANNANSQGGNGVRANGPGHDGHGPNGSAVTEAAACGGKGLGEEDAASGADAGADGPGRNGRGANDTDESGGLERCCHCKAVRRRASAHEGDGGQVEGEAVEVMERKTVLIRTVRVDEDVLERDVTEKTITINGATV